MNNIKNKILKIICKQFNISKEKALKINSFKEDIEADSLDIIELVMEIEEKFNIEIKDDEVEKLDNLNSIEKYIKNKFVLDKKNI